jgi:hypothetical protein
MAVIVNGKFCIVLCIDGPRYRSQRRFMFASREC